MTDSSIRAFFQMYSHHVQAALDGEADIEYVASAFWADSYVHSSVAGISTGHNDDGLIRKLEGIVKGYRARGVKRVHLRDMAVTRIGDYHASVLVGWQGSSGAGDKKVDFEICYLLRQDRAGEMRIFGLLGVAG
jgi:hypothetical protein